MGAGREEEVQNHELLGLLHPTEGKGKNLDLPTGRESLCQQLAEKVPLLEKELRSDRSTHHRNPKRTAPLIGFRSEKAKLIDLGVYQPPIEDVRAQAWIPHEAEIGMQHVLRYVGWSASWGQTSLSRLVVRRVQ